MEVKDIKIHSGPNLMDCSKHRCHSIEDKIKISEEMRQESLNALNSFISRYTLIDEGHDGIQAHRNEDYTQTRSIGIKDLFKDNELEEFAEGGQGLIYKLRIANREFRVLKLYRRGGEKAFRQELCIIQLLGSWCRSLTTGEEYAIVSEAGTSALSESTYEQVQAVSRLCGE